MQEKLFCVQTRNMVMAANGIKPRHQEHHHGFLLGEVAAIL